ncbi:MAG: hypothetical protein U0Q10_12845 [Dermatophilaceae bacterium]
MKASVKAGHRAVVRCTRWPKPASRRAISSVAAATCGSARTPGVTDRVVQAIRRGPGSPAAVSANGSCGFGNCQRSAGREPAMASRSMA